MPNQKARQSEATQRKIMRVARRLFGRHGYSETSIEEVVSRAGLTRGALYHHYKNKQDLFRAVLQAEWQGLAIALMERLEGVNDPWERLDTGTQSFLDLCGDSAFQRIALLDAPSVLGLTEWRELEAQFGVGMVAASLQVAMDTGAIIPQPVEPLAHLVNALLGEAAVFIARADDPIVARVEVGDAVRHVLEGLRVHAP